MKRFCYVLSILVPCALLGLVGFGVSSPAVVAAASAPTVTISANPTLITKGSSSVLTVTATNATGITITGTNGSKRTMAKTGGTLSVSPTSGTTYTATATGAGGTATASVTITVKTGSTTGAPTVTISGNPTTITKGSSSVLTVTATNATGVTITGTNGSKRTTAAGGGAISVSPTSTTTYTATATGTGGTATASVTITVTTGSTSGTPTVTISANPTSMAKGSSSVLTVTATNATGITITGTNGSKRTLPAAGGTITVSPTSTTTYTATATGSGGTASASATVTVTTGSGGTTEQLTVATAGNGAGTVTSSSGGINCPGTCTASFNKGTAIVLTATAQGGNSFTGWSGACTGTNACSVTLNANSTVTATFEQGTAGITSINHIVFFAQENRSLDNYFGAMREYWKNNGYPDQSFDGLPQFNPTSGAAPLYGPPPAIPGCNPADPPPSSCSFDKSNPVASFHMKSVCNENTSPSWNEAHNDYDFGDPEGNKPAKNDGFVHTAAGDARVNGGHPFYDVNGLRAMGYWDGTDLNYDYFIASNFATSDRFFHPVLDRTEVNRSYLEAATSQGYAYQNGSDAQDEAQHKAHPIWEELQSAGITWKVYINGDGTGCAQPYQPACLVKTVALDGFTYVNTILANFPQNIAPITEYFTDLTNGTLPQVAEIFAASDAGFDEHGSVSDATPINVQRGARYTSTLINALMQSSAWHDSVFFFTFDESGGLYDHVSPQPAVSPDGIKPVDLKPGDICNKGDSGPLCDFTSTGYRIPLTVISPYAKKNYVSHTVADETAILKFIETRFGLPALTKRDAAQPDMTEFFDFNNPPWMTPPTPPSQNVSNPCYLTTVP